MEPRGRLHAPAVRHGSRPAAIVQRQVQFAAAEMARGHISQFSLDRAKLVGSVKAISLFMKRFLAFVAATNQVLLFFGLLGALCLLGYTLYDEFRPHGPEGVPISRIRTTTGA